MAASAALAVLGLSALACVRAQVTDISLVFPATEFSDLPLSGEIVGTGVDGTTYVVSAAGTDAGDIPFTMTIVQDASHVSEVLAIATDVGADAQCVYNTQGAGTCTFVFEDAGTASVAEPQTSVVTGTIPMIAVPVSTGSADPSSASDSDSGDGASEVATGSAGATEASSTSAAARSSVTVAQVLVAILPIVMALVAFLSA